jgi:PAS domain S-box-containing protein
MPGIDDQTFDLNLLLPPIIQAVKDSSFIVYIKDSNDNFRYLNLSAIDAIGANLDTIKNKTFIEGSKEKEIYDSLFANDVHVLTKGEPKSELYSIGKGDPLSKESTWHFTKQPIHGPDGNDYILGFGVEITNKLVGNSTLNFFKDLLNHMTDSFVITEIEYPYRIRYANSAYLKLTGYSNFSDVLGKAPTEVLQKFSLEDEQRELFNERLEKREICSVVFTNKNKNGKVFKTHLIVIPISDNYFMGIQRDITDSFIKNEAIRKKTSQLNAIFNSISSYLWLLSPDLTVLQMNRAAQIQGKYVNTQYKIKPGLKFLDGRWWKSNKESHDNLAKTLQEVMRKGTKQEIITDFLNANDQVRKIRLTINPNRDASGNVDYVVVDGADVTALEKEKRQFQQIASSSFSSHKVDEWQQTGLEGKELERVVKTESTVEVLVPQVFDLTKLIKDPETGLVVRVGKIDNNIEKLVEKVDSAESFLQMWGIAKRVPAIVRNPVVKWLLVGMVGSIIVNNVGFTLNKVSSWIQDSNIIQLIKELNQP